MGSLTDKQNLSFWVYCFIYNVFIAATSAKEVDILR